MRVLIDPYMFELSSEQEISDNITFYLDVIKIASSIEKEKRIFIAIYKGMIEKMQNREIQPFPIKIGMIQDIDLKDTIVQLNNSFSNALIKFIEDIDINQCSGNQEFEVSNDVEMKEDMHYFELLSTLLISCYSETIKLDSRILTGNKVKGKQIGDSFELVCKCDKNSYKQDYNFISTNKLFSEREKVVLELKKMKNNGEINISKTVDASMGNHHNYVQANGKKFSNLDDLSLRNRRVLSLLKKLGLLRIIFGKFKSKGMKEIGTMSIKKVDLKDSQDIVLVDFSSETNMVIETSLYFPKGVGGLLEHYFKSEKLTYKSVNELIDKMG